MKRFLLREFHLLHVATLEVRHLAVELHEVDGRIDLISKEYGLLLSDVRLAGKDLDKQFVAAACLLPSFLLFVAFVLAVSPIALRRRVATRGDNLDRCGSQVVAPRVEACWRDGERAALTRYEDVGHGDRRRGGGVAVDVLETRLLRPERSVATLQPAGEASDVEVSHVARVDRIFDLKFLTHHHMAWSRHLHPLGVEAGDCREERTYQYQSLHICLVSSLPVFVQLSLVGLAHGLFQPLLRLLLLQHGRIEQ